MCMTSKASKKEVQNTPDKGLLVTPNQLKVQLYMSWLTQQAVLRIISAKFRILLSISYRCHFPMQREQKVCPQSSVIGCRTVLRQIEHSIILLIVDNI